MARRLVVELLDAIATRRANRTLSHIEIEKWNYRLVQMLRERILSVINTQAVQFHAERVANQLEDPYIAVEALMRETLPTESR